MNEYLTENNGVICRYCFKTVDLTKIEWKQRSQTLLFLDRIFGPKSSFMLTCPNCKTKGGYSYYDDIKPISSWQDMEKAYQEKIEALFVKILELKGDNVTMAKELALKEIADLKNASKEDSSHQLTDLNEKKEGPYN